MDADQRAALEAELRNEQACLWVYTYVIGGAPPRAVRAAGRVREIERLLGLAPEDGKPAAEAPSGA